MEKNLGQARLPFACQKLSSSVRTRLLGNLLAYDFDIFAFLKFLIPNMTNKFKQRIWVIQPSLTLYYYFQRVSTSG